MKKYFQLMRVKQWIKNLFIFAPVIFSRHLSDARDLSTVFLAFLTFSLSSSAVYIFNDINDVESDRLHPIKKNRPIARGVISIKKAVFLLAIIIALVVASITLFNYSFIAVLFAYILLNVFYTIKLKNVVIIDLMSIAAGFMLRVIGGAFVIEVYISSWLILATLFISLFLAVMKRRSELDVTQTDSPGTRKVLAEYSSNFIEQIVSVSAAGVIICYALYTVSERTIREFNTEAMIYTTVFVVFGIFRFMYLVYKKSKGENATEIMLTDAPMIINILLYILTIIIIVYI
ncbi:MAG TPA: decaprenyl-phosphate phosphoribosyltransferase [Ignavibacteriales bacterium]|nr:decaprenyl-phosphate phosphoribosyltransferase [Ignavibacteriales bacterium]